MAFLSLKYKIAILAICLVFIPFESKGDECKLSVEEELILKQGKMDLRINYLERMLQNALQEMDNNHQQTEHLEADNAEHWKLVNLMTNMTKNRGFFQAYMSGKCYKGVRPNEYAGNIATTVNGKTCQRWNQQYPHEHEYTNISTYPEDSLFDAENYCRDPIGNTGYTWCFTTDPNERWEPCEVTRCMTEFDTEQCYHFHEKASAYKGHLNETISGRTCQRWDNQYPIARNYTDDLMFPEGSAYGASNSCRDPMNWGHPWCYTTDGEHRWEICDVARCAE